MFSLKKLDTIKALKGKLNHLKKKDQSVMALTSLANSLGNFPQQSSSLNKYTLEDIHTLKNTETLSRDEVDQLVFDCYVHRSVAQGKVGTTIYEPLNRQQKRIVSSLLNCTDKLNSRQMLYLQYITRKKLENVYPHWDNLHFTPDSPFLRDFLVIPSVSNIRSLYELKTIPKKKVMVAIAEAQRQSEAEA